MTTVTSSTPVAVRLRFGTSAAHAQLEARLDLLGPTLTRERYRRLLERLHGFHAVLEPRLDAWHARDPVLDWPARRKLGLLAADLADLHRGHPGNLPRCPDVPEVENTARALGVLYVVEGATLGGTLIAAHLRDTDVPTGALRFFSCYGDQVGRRWRRWRQATDTWVGADPARSDAVVESATETFTVLARWLAPAGVVR